MTKPTAEDLAQAIAEAEAMLASLRASAANQSTAKQSAGATKATKVGERKKRRGWGAGTVEERTPGRWRALVDIAPDDAPVRQRVSKTFTTKGEAEKWLKLQQAKRINGEAPPDAVRDGQTVGEYLAAWLAGPHVNTPRLSDATRIQYAQVTKSYLLPVIGNVKLQKLSARKITQALIELAKPGAAPSAGTGRTRTAGTLSPNTVALAQRTLRVALTCAVRDGLLTLNPASASVLPYKKGTIRSTPDPLTTEELEKVQAVWSTHRIRPLVQFALSTGLRLGELVAIRFADCDAEGWVLSVDRHSAKSVEGSHKIVGGTKTGIGRRVPLGYAAREAIALERKLQAAERLRAGSGWADHGLIFASGIGTPASHRNVQRDWHTLCDAAGIDRRGIHKLRHSAGSYLHEGGMSLELVGGVLGHARVETTQGYALTGDNLRAPAATILDAKLRGNANSN